MKKASRTFSRFFHKYQSFCISFFTHLFHCKQLWTDRWNQRRTSKISLCRCKQYCRRINRFYNSFDVSILSTVFNPFSGHFNSEKGLTFIHVHSVIHPMRALMLLYFVQQPSLQFLYHSKMVGHNKRIIQQSSTNTWITNLPRSSTPAPLPRPTTTKTGETGETAMEQEESTEHQLGKGRFVGNNSSERVVALEDRDCMQGSVHGGLEESLPGQRWRKCEWQA